MLKLDLFRKGLAEAGFPEADLEQEGEILILRLAPLQEKRLLLDQVLRRRLIEEAKKLGFTRLSLEI